MKTKHKVMYTLMLSLAICSIYIRFENPSLTETELFLKMIGAY